MASPAPAAYSAGVAQPGKQRREEGNGAASPSLPVQNTLLVLWVLWGLSLEQGKHSFQVSLPVESVLLDKTSLRWWGCTRPLNNMWGDPLFLPLIRLHECLVLASGLGCGQLTKREPFLGQGHTGLQGTDQFLGWSPAKFFINQPSNSAGWPPSNGKQ